MYFTYPPTNQQKKTYKERILTFVIFLTHLKGAPKVQSFDSK